MRKYAIVCALILCSLCEFAASASAGEYYRWTDVNGTVHYSDSPVINADSTMGKAEKITIPDLEQEEATHKRKSGKGRHKKRHKKVRRE